MPKKRWRKQSRNTRHNRNGSHGHIPIYRTYNFSGQDPAVSELLGQIGDIRKVCEDSGVAVSTIRNWRDQKTRRPKFATMQATAMALGMHYVLSDIKK